ncbi:MAG: OmpA family protein [Thiobacillus sp.]
MRRRRLRLPRDYENPDRWLISYADFITLLFAFFVAMYAMSSSGGAKYRQVSSAIESSFGKVPVTPQDAVTQVVESLSEEAKQQLVARQKAKQAREKTDRMASNLLDVMAPLVKEGKVRVTQNRQGISIEINANVLFQPGEAELHMSAYGILRTVAEILRGETYDIEISGHTDNRPISNSEFASNWELSAVRASRVVRLMSDSGIASPRLKAIGREASQPIAPNETDTGRARNRRVELLILTSTPDRIEAVNPKSPVSQ